MRQFVNAVGSVIVFTMLPPVSDAHSPGVSWIEPCEAEECCPPFMIGFSGASPIDAAELDLVTGEVALTLTNEHPVANVLIAGRADATGELDRESLLELSLLRAETVKSGLVEQGVLEGRIRTTGYGAERPGGHYCPEIDDSVELAIIEAADGWSVLNTVP